MARPHRWRILYRDLFDPDLPPQPEREGEGLDVGLRELWRLMTGEFTANVFADFWLEVHLADGAIRPIVVARQADVHGSDGWRVIDPRDRPVALARIGAWSATSPEVLDAVAVEHARLIDGRADSTSDEADPILAAAMLTDDATEFLAAIGGRSRPWPAPPSSPDP